MKSKITIPQAELAGFHTGDGTLYNTSRGIVWELRGNLDEKDFYDDYIHNIISLATSQQLVGKYRSGGKNGCYGFQTSKKTIIDLFLRIGFAPGKKSHSITIPNRIIKNDQLIKPFLRGLFAADGTAYTAKVNGEKSYPMIELGSASKNLVSQVSSILITLGINNYSWKYTSKKDLSTTHYLRISGIKRCEIFARTIGLINPKHYSRLQGIIRFKSNSAVLDNKDSAEIA